MKKSHAQHAVASRSNRLSQGAQRVEVIIDDPETLAAFELAIARAGNKADAVRLALRLAFPADKAAPATATDERVQSWSAKAIPGDEAIVVGPASAISGLTPLSPVAVSRSCEQ